MGGLFFVGLLEALGGAWGARCLAPRVPGALGALGAGVLGMPGVPKVLGGWGVRGASGSLHGGRAVGGLGN